MNDTFLLTLKQKLETCILDLSNIRSLFSLHPGADFSRDRKITFPDLVNMLLQAFPARLYHKVGESSVEDGVESVDFWDQ